MKTIAYIIVIGSILTSCFQEQPAEYKNQPEIVNTSKLKTPEERLDSILKLALKSQEKVERLDLYYFALKGGLKEFPIEVCSFTNLRYLNLFGHLFKTIPPEIGNLQKLDTLILEANSDLEQLPKEFGNLNLKYLNIQNANLRHFPIEICQLDSLEYLDIMKNQITEVPSEIGQLKNLKTLYLNNTAIHSLPKEIGQLEKLEELWLINTDITDLPKEFANLSSLKYLYIFPSPELKLKIEHLVPNVIIDRRR